MEPTCRKACELFIGRYRPSKLVAFMPPGSLVWTGKPVRLTRTWYLPERLRMLAIGASGDERWTVLPRGTKRLAGNPLPHNNLQHRLAW